MADFCFPMFRLRLLVTTTANCIQGERHELVVLRSDDTYPTINQAKLWYQEQIEKGEIVPSSEFTVRFVPDGYTFNNGILSPNKYHHARYKDSYCEDTDALTLRVGAIQLTEPRDMRFRWLLYTRCIDCESFGDHIKLKVASPFFGTLQECLRNLYSVRVGTSLVLVEARYADTLL